MRLLSAGLVVLAAGCAEPAAPPTGPGAGTTFIALARDFVGFPAWPRFEVAGAAIPDGAEPGPTYVYAREVPEEGYSRLPVGAIFVKTIENGPPSAWFVHAMAKRSADFNRDGAIGWEFFELSLTDAHEPIIVWRGEGPPSGHGYGSFGTPDPAAIPLVCNDCHAAAWMTDGVLSPELAGR